MSHRFEEDLIRHCAATLAGHKCGSLFSCQRAPGEDVRANLEQANEVLREKGVRACLLRECEKGGLVYVYRPSMLAERLSRPDVQAFLRAQGYEDFEVPGALETLRTHVRPGEEFPHEIGVFLDYPLSDAIAFIEHKGCCFQCAGCWKAYSNVAEAQRLFALYRKCREVYLSCYACGFSVSRLTIAA